MWGANYGNPQFQTGYTQFQQQPQYQTTNSEWSYLDGIDPLSLSLPNDLKILQKVSKHFVRTTVLNVDTTERMQKLLQILQLVIKEISSKSSKRKQKIKSLKKQLAAKQDKQCKQKQQKEAQVVQIVACRCPVCQLGFKSLPYLDAHVFTKHQEVATLWQAIRTPQPPGAYAFPWTKSYSVHSSILPPNSGTVHTFNEDAVLKMMEEFRKRYETERRASEKETHTMIKKEMAKFTAKMEKMKLKATEVVPPAKLESPPKPVEKKVSTPKHIEQEKPVEQNVRPKPAELPKPTVLPPVREDVVFEETKQVKAPHVNLPQEESVIPINKQRQVSLEDLLSENSGEGEELDSFVPGMQPEYSEFEELPETNQHEVEEFFEEEEEEFLEDLYHAEPPPGRGILHHTDSLEEGTVRPPEELDYSGGFSQGYSSKRLLDAKMFSSPNNSGSVANESISHMSFTDIPRVIDPAATYNATYEEEEFFSDFRDEDQDLDEDYRDDQFAGFGSTERPPVMAPLLDYENQRNYGHTADFDGFDIDDMDLV